VFHFSGGAKYPEQAVALLRQCPFFQKQDPQIVELAAETLHGMYGSGDRERPWIDLAWPPPFFDRLIERIQADHPEELGQMRQNLGVGSGAGFKEEAEAAEGGAGGGLGDAEADLVSGHGVR